MLSSCRVAVSPSSPKASLWSRDDASSSVSVDRCSEGVARCHEKAARWSEDAASSSGGATSCRRSVSPSSKSAAPSSESDASCRLKAAVWSESAASCRLEASPCRQSVSLSRLDDAPCRLDDAFSRQRATSSRTRAGRAAVDDGAGLRSAAARRRRCFYPWGESALGARDVASGGAALSCSRGKPLFLLRRVPTRPRRSGAVGGAPKLLRGG